MEEREPVPFARLAHDIAQVSYRDLLSLLDSLTDLDDDDRKERLIDYIVATRQRLVRFLVAVRWSLTYSSYHLTAGSCISAANDRGNKPMEAADRLFFVNSLARGAAAPASAVAFAAEMLGNGLSSYRLPCGIARSIGIEAPSRGKKRSSPDEPCEVLMPPVKRGSRFHEDEPESTMRLRLATRCAIQMGLPKGIRIVSLNVEPEKVAVRIGLKDAWHADVMLDSSDISKANFRVLDLKILVRADPDAIGSKSVSSKDVPLPILAEQSRMIIERVEDRVSWAVLDADRAGACAKARVEAGLQCLCMMVSRDVCTTLVMQFLRDQAKVLARHRSWRSSSLSVEDFGTREGLEIPLSLEYWQGSPFKSKVRIEVPTDDGYLKSDSPSANGDPTVVVNVKHEPALPYVGPDVVFSMNALNVESLVLACARRRAVDLFARIFEKLKGQVSFISSTAVASHGPSMESVAIDIAKTGFSVLLGIDLKSGSFTARLCGVSSIPSVKRSEYALSVQRAMWLGQKHFPNGINGVVHALKKIFNAQTQTLKHSQFLLCASFADQVALSSWPPTSQTGVEKWKEKCSVRGIVPPFLAAECGPPTSFLSAYAWEDPEEEKEPNEKENKTEVDLSGRCVQTPECIMLLKGLNIGDVKFTNDDTCLAPTSSRSAMWCELRQMNSVLIRRNFILSELKKSDITITEPPSSASDVLKPTPIDLRDKKVFNTPRAHLVIESPSSWKLKLQVPSNSFDVMEGNDFVYCRGVNYVDGANSSITFSYPAVDSFYLAEFKDDFCRVSRFIWLARLVHCCPKFSVLVRSPRRLQFNAFELVWNITWKYGFKVSVRGERDLSRIEHCLPQVTLLEEFFAENWRALNEKKLEIILECISTSIRTVEPLVSSGTVKCYRFRYANVTTLKLVNRDDLNLFIDLDFRHRTDFALVSDLSTSSKGTEQSASGSSAHDSAAGTNSAANGNATRPSHNAPVPVPNWTAVVQQFVNSGQCKLTTTRTSVFVLNTALPSFFKALSEGVL